MYKYAQILNGKVHWIMAHEADLATLYEKYFNKDQVTFVDITDTPNVQEGDDYDPETNTFSPATFSTSLDDVKAAKWEEIKATRDTLEEAGFSYLNKMFDSDQKSALRISIAVQAAQEALADGQNYSIDWTCQDNSVLTMTAAQVVGMPVAMAQYSNTLHEKARLLREKIEAATTTEEVEAITWEST